MDNKESLSGGGGVPSRQEAFLKYLRQRSEHVGYDKPYSEVATMNESDLKDYCRTQLTVLEELCVGLDGKSLVTIHFPSASSGKYEEAFLSLLNTNGWTQRKGFEAYISDQFQDLLPRNYVIGRIPVHTFAYTAGHGIHDDSERKIFTFVWERLGSLWHAADFDYMHRGREKPDAHDIQELLLPNSQYMLRSMLDSHFHTIEEGGAYIVDAYTQKGFPPSTLDLIKRLLGDSKVTVTSLLATWGYSLELLPKETAPESPRFAVIRRIRTKL
jgi:hypothetical protein